MNLGNLPLPLQTFGLLVLSNLFMTVAWYGHLKNMAGKTWLWLHAGATEDRAGGHHAGGVCAFRGLLHAAAAGVGLPVGRPVPPGCRVLHLQVVALSTPRIAR